MLADTRVQRRLWLGIKLAVIALAIAFALFPIAWVLSAALSPSNTIVGQSIIPRNAGLVNFERLLTSTHHPFLLWLFNSVKISTITVVIIVSLTALAAYSFSRFRYRGRRAALLGTFLVQLFPSLLAIVALFLLLQQVGAIVPWLGLNSHGGLILIYSGGALGFNVWLMKGYFDTIPRDLDESALVDGASHFQAFIYVVLPLVRPVLAVIAILTFIATYSDFLLPRVMLTSTDQYTLAVGLALFIQGQYTEQWGVFAAGALIGALPVVILFLLLQRQLIGGLAQGGVKG